MGTKRIVEVESDTDSDYENNQVVDTQVRAKKKRKIDEDTLKMIGVVPGKCIVGRIWIPSSTSLAYIQVSSDIALVLPSTEVDISDNWKSNGISCLKNESFVKCVVLEPITNRYGEIEHTVSIRPDLLESVDESTKTLPKEILKQERIESTQLPAPGSLVKGFVESADSAGVFVRISRGILALVPLRFLSNGFVKNVPEEFPIGKLVAGRVMKTDTQKNSVILSLEASQVLGAKYNWDNINVGDVVKGTVNKVEPFGAFVSIDNSANVFGLCHRSKLGAKPVEDATMTISKGDKVKVYILDVNKEKKRLSLSMEPSYFEGYQEEDSEGEDDESEKEEEEEEEHHEAVHGKVIKPVDSSDDDDDDSDVEKLIADAQVSSDESEDDENDNHSSIPDEESSDDDVSEKMVSKKSISLKQALLTANVKTNTTEDEDESSSDEGEIDEEETQVKDKRKKSSKAKQREKKREEAEIAAKEQALLEDPSAPQTTDDFERLLIASPNSSMLWIQYMAFQIAQTEIDQARAIAKRGVRTINFREETEKQNVLFALLNLEYKYGTAESVNNLMKEITPQMNPKHAYYKLAEIQIDSGDYPKADATLKKAVKVSKGESRNGWFKRIELKLVHMNDSKGARELLQNALRSIPTRKHPKLILDFARLEFSHSKGDAERARTLCEGLIESYPKRNDIWHQYIDLEIKFGDDVRRVRNLFERVLTLNFSVKKVKAFFKKWLMFETEQGSDSEADAVKEKAREYVEALAS